MVKLIETAHKADERLIAELDLLMTEARAGRLRGLLFVAHRVGTDEKRFGNVGEYSLADFALGIKLLELELDSIVTHGQEPD